MRQWREKAGKSLTDVAAAMGFTVPYIRDLESGRRFWSERLLEKYNNALTS